jgi:isopenicillin-N N-acyltransferase-like protein
MIRRKAFEAAEPAVAIALVASTPNSTSNYMTISRANGQVLGLGCAPDECFVVEPEAGLLVHANRWTSPVALSKLRERGLDCDADTLFRAGGSVGCSPHGGGSGSRT